MKTIPLPCRRPAFRLLTLAAVFLCMVGCTPTEEETPDPDPTPPVPAAPIAFSVPDLSFGDGAGNNDFTITATEDWTITTSEVRATQWWKVQPTSGKKGQTVTVTVTTEANDTYDDRSVNITVKAGSNTKVMTVSQRRKEGLTVTSQKVNLSNDGGKVTVEVKHNLDFNISIRASDKSWISEAVSQNAGRGLTTTTRSYTVEPNTDLEPREGWILLTAGSLKDTVKVFQSPTSALVLLGGTCNAPTAGGEFDVELRTNVDYDMTIPGGEGWLMISKTGTLDRVDKFRLSVMPNIGYDNRMAKVAFKDRNSSLTDTLYVWQAQKDAIILQDKLFNAGAGETYAGVFVRQNVSDYDIVFDGTTGDWVSVFSRPSRGLVTDEVTLKIKANTTTDDREGKAIFRLKDNPFISDTLYIHQESGVKALNVLAGDKHRTFNNESHIFDVSVTQNTGYTVWMDPSTELWLKQTSDPGRAMTTDKLWFQAYAYYDDVPREGKVYFTSTADPKVADTLYVTQLGYGYIRVSAKKTMSISAVGIYTEETSTTADKIRAQSNVPFTMVVDPACAEWIACATSPDKVAGTGQVIDLLIKSNRGTATRTGKVILRHASTAALSDTVYITQAGCAPGISIPDPNFRAFCLQHFDTNGDGMLTADEAAAVKKIALPGTTVFGVFSSADIRSLEGIEYFTALEELSLFSYESGSGSNPWVRLTLPNVLDLSKNTKLKKLEYWIKTMSVSILPKTLDLSANTALESLQLTVSPFQTLDLSANTALEHFEALSTTLVNANNEPIYTFPPQLKSFKATNGTLGTTFDLTGCPQLRKVDIYNSTCDVLDLSTSTKLDSLIYNSLIPKSILLPARTDLTYIYLNGWGDVSIDLRRCPKLKYLGSWASMDADISNCLELETFICKAYLGTVLNMSGLTRLKQVEATFVDALNADFSGCTALEELMMSGKNFGKNKASFATLNIDLTGCNALRDVSIGSFVVPNLDLSNRTSLKTVGLGWTDYINLSGCSALESIQTYSYTNGDWGSVSYQTKSIDLSGCTALKDADFRYINAAMDLSSCSALENLKLGTSTDFKAPPVDIGMPDLSGCPKLKTLSCYAKGDLDFSPNPDLRNLMIYGGSFNTTVTSLNVTKCTELDTLNMFYYAGAQNLDLTKNTKLTYLSTSFGYSAATGLDLSANTKLKDLTLSGMDKFTSLTLSNLPALEKILIRNIPNITSLSLIKSSLLKTAQFDLHSAFTDLDISSSRSMESFFLYYYDSNVLSVWVPADWETCHPYTIPTYTSPIYKVKP